MMLQVYLFPVADAYFYYSFSKLLVPMKHFEIPQLSSCYPESSGRKIFFYISGKEGIYLEDHVADNVDDRFSFRSNDPNNYSPSFYHFRPTKTSVSRPSGSIRKESRSDSPFYKAGNSYTGIKDSIYVSKNILSFGWIFSLYLIYL